MMNRNRWFCNLTIIVANEELKADFKENANELDRGTSNTSTITNTISNSNANPTTATASIEYEHQKKASLI